MKKKGILISKYMIPTLILKIIYGYQIDMEF